MTTPALQLMGAKSRMADDYPKYIRCEILCDEEYICAGIKTLTFCEECNGAGIIDCAECERCNGEGELCNVEFDSADFWYDE